MAEHHENGTRQNGALEVERVELTRDGVIALAEKEAQELLGVSADEAFCLLDSGKLGSSLVESEFRALRALLDG